MPTKKSQEKKSIEEDEITSEPIPELPYYVTKRYTTDELNYILEYAKRVFPDYKSTSSDESSEDESSVDSAYFDYAQMLRVEESTTQEKDRLIQALLVKMSQEAKGFYDFDFNVEDLHLNPRVSQNIDEQHIPYAMATLVKRGFMNWDFLDKYNTYLDRVHQTFEDRFSTVFNSLPQLTQPQVQLGSIFNPFNEFRNPVLVYAAQMLLVAFITDLTANRYTDEAKVLHQFILICKRILRSSQSESSQPLLSRMIAPVLLEGLHLKAVSKDEGMLDLFLSSVLYLTMRHPLFDEDYSPEIYLLYSRLSEKCEALGIGVRINPMLAARDVKSDLRDKLERDYKFVTNLYPDKGKMALRGILNFYVNTITTEYEFERDDKAIQTHNLLYIVGMLCEEDKLIPHRAQQYAKMLRQIFQLPSVSPEIDAWFDDITIRLIQQGEVSMHFKTPFEHQKYPLNGIQSVRFSRKLQESLNESRQTNIALHKEVHKLESLLEDAAAQRERLEEKLKLVQRKLVDLSIEDKQPSPSSSPPSQRHHFSRLRRGSDNKPEEVDRRTLLAHTLSDGAIIKPKQKK